MAVPGAGLPAAALALRGLEVDRRRRGRGGDGGGGGLQFGEPPGDDQGEEDDGLGAEGVELEGLFAGEVAAEGRRDNGVEVGRLGRQVADRRLSIIAEAEAQCLT